MSHLSVCYHCREIFAEPVSGAVLRYQATADTRLFVCLDSPDAAPAAVFTVPRCAEPNKQLFALDAVLDGEHEVYLLTDAEGLRLLEVRFCAAQAIVRGTNPVINADMPDPDIIRVDDAYYMASTTMHNMPGGSMLRSYDLIHWELASYLYDTLPPTDERALNGGDVYGKGMWAPTLRYHAGVFHVCFSANDTHCTYHYWSSDFSGPWQMAVMRDFYYDCSLFFDDDDRAYMVHGHRHVYLTELDDALTGAKAGGLHRLLIDYDVHYPGSSLLGYEGSHLYKHEGRYLLFSIHSNPNAWYREESCFSAARLTDDFVGGVVLHDDMGYFGQGVAQGGMVDTPDGRWYAFLFQDRGASGRMPVLTPMRWENGMPVLGFSGRVEEAVCNLSTRPGHVYAPISGSDAFTAPTLSPVWQWNHAPLLSHVTVGGGQLRIKTDCVCGTLTGVHNLLTQRTLSPVCTAQVTVSAEELNSGDMAGVCAFQNCYAAIGLRRTDAGGMIEVICRDPDDPAEGRVTASLPWHDLHATLRVVMDFTDMRDLAHLDVLTKDGWQHLYSGHALRFTLDHFTGNKAGLFVLCTRTPGGTAVFSDFRLDTGTNT